MIEWLKRFWIYVSWKDVISRTIASLLSNAILTILGIVVVVFGAMIASLRQDVTISRWWYGLLIVCFVLLILGVAYQYFPRARSKYREDVFLGMRWRWHYGKGNTVIELKSFCTVCDRRIQGKNEDNDNNVGAEYICSEHGNTFHDPQRSVGEVRESVKHEIQRKLRNGEYKAIIADQGD